MDKTIDNIFKTIDNLHQELSSTSKKKSKLCFCCMKPMKRGQQYYHGNCTTRFLIMYLDTDTLKNQLQVVTQSMRDYYL